MLKSHNPVFIFTVLMMIAINVIHGQTIDHIERILPPTTPYHQAHIKAYDVFANAWNIYCNQPGLGMQYGWEIVNEGSDIRIMNGQFQVGIQGGETGSIVNLGNADDIAQTYNTDSRYSFSSISFSSSGSLQIASKDSISGSYTPKYTPISVPALFTAGSDTANIALGNIYLVRIQNSKQESVLVAKFMVTGFAKLPNNNVEYVTLTTQTMYVKQGRSICNQPPIIEDEKSLAESAIALSIFALIFGIASGVGNIAFVIYYCAMKGKNSYSQVN